VFKIRYSTETSIPNFKSQLEGFDYFFQIQVKAVVANLAVSGVTEARKVIRNAKTEWGKSRMAGNHYGVRFAPYGRSEGREDTGFMYDSLIARVIPGGKDSWKGTWGWSANTLHRAPYIRYQDQGFMSAGRFDPVATAATGKAQFSGGSGAQPWRGGASGSKWIEGAGSMYKSRDEVAKRTQSAFSAAWNEATIEFRKAGKKGDPGSYLKARGDAFTREFEKKLKERQANFAKKQRARRGN
jgi:hypothetical protein